jgi:ribosomal protein S18 acetylase RimI-like enzyme
MNKDYEIVEQNLRQSLRFFARANPAGEVHETPGVTMISCGKNYPLFNSALLATKTPGPGGDLASRITVPASYFSALGFGWSYWVCEGMLDEEGRRAEAGLFHSRGLHRVVGTPGMVAGHLTKPRLPLPNLDFRRIEQAHHRIAFCHITAMVFEIPFPMSRDVYDCESAWRSDFIGYLGYLNGEPVTSTVVVITGDVAGLYSVATLPAHQHKGLGEATVRYAIEQIRAERGIEKFVLQSSREGLGLYVRLGFREVCRFTIYRT